MKSLEQLHKEFDQAAKDCDRLLNYLQYADPNEDMHNLPEAKDYIDCLIDRETIGDLIYGDGFQLEIIELRKKVGNQWWMFSKY